MLKKFLSVVLFLVSVQLANAQKINMVWGQESKSDVTYHSFVRGSNGDLIKLCFEEKGREVLPILTRYNTKLEEQTVKNIMVSEDNVKFDRLLGIKGNLFFYTNIYNKKEKNTSFYCQPLNVNTFTFDGSNQNLGAMDAIRKSEQSTVGYAISEDSTKVLMIGLTPFVKNDAEKYYIAVYDSGMKKQWENTVALPFKDKFVAILGQIVTNDGKVAILLKHYDKETTDEDIRKNGKRIPAYTTKILVYDKGETAPHEYIVNIGDKFVHSLKIAGDAGNGLTLFGLYKQKSEGFVNGYFISNINTASKTVSTTNINPFPEGLLEMVKTDKQGSDDGKDAGLAEHFKFVKMVTRDNGDRDFLVEYREVINSPRSAYILYKCGDIIDVNVKKDGRNVIARIPKMQVSVDDDYLSFKAMPYKDKLLLFYNDDDENVTKDLSKKPDPTSFPVITEYGFSLGGKHAVLCMASIDGDGNLSRKVLVDKEASKYVTAVNVSFFTEKNKIALYAKKGRKDMIGYLVVE